MVAGRILRMSGGGKGAGQKDRKRKARKTHERHRPYLIGNGSAGRRPAQKRGRKPKKAAKTYHGGPLGQMNYRSFSRGRGSAENDTRPVKSRVVQASGRNFPSRLFDPWRRPIRIYRLRLRGRRRLTHRGGRFGGGLIRRCRLLVGIDRLRWRRRFAHRRL